MRYAPLLRGTTDRRRPRSPDRRYVDFTVPRFGEFMARYMPFRPPRRRKPPS
jgi:hypothetical protein